MFRMPMLLFGLFCLLHRRNVRRRDREGGFGPIVHNNDGYFAAGTVIWTLIGSGLFSLGVGAPD